MTSVKTHSDLSDISRSIIAKDKPKKGKIENLDPLAVLDHGKSGGMFVDQSENILELQQEEIREGYRSITAPMQGMIVKFDVEIGDSVWEGKTLGIMEAMKMEHEIISEVSGIVEDISVSSLDTVFEGHSLMTIRLEKVEKQTSNEDEEIDLDWIRPDL